jgi:hypothetical protein
MLVVVRRLNRSKNIDAEEFLSFLKKSNHERKSLIKMRGDWQSRPPHVKRGMCHVEWQEAGDVAVMRLVCWL